MTDYDKIADELHRLSIEAKLDEIADQLHRDYITKKENN